MKFDIFKEAQLISNFTMGLKKTSNQTKHKNKSRQKINEQKNNKKCFSIIFDV